MSDKAKEASDAMRKVLPLDALKSMTKKDKQDLRVIAAMYHTAAAISCIATCEWQKMQGHSLKARELLAEYEKEKDE